MLLVILCVCFQRERSAFSTAWKETMERGIGLARGASGIEGMSKTFKRELEEIREPKKVASLIGESYNIVETEKQGKGIVTVAEGTFCQRPERPINERRDVAVKNSLDQGSLCFTNAIFAIIS